MVSLVSHTSRRGRLALFLPIFLALFLAACGSTDHEKIPLAKIGDDTITLAQFERKVDSMNPKYLPDDIMTKQGKLDYLDAMINKRVMERKGDELGYAEDPSMKQTLELIRQNAAMRLMKSELVKDTSEVTPEEMQAYYKNFCRVLLISYMVFDTEEEAEKARNLVLGGERWADVAGRMDSGDPGPSGDWTASLRYGTVPDDVEQAAFELKPHELSQPIHNAAGYFLIRLEGETKDQKVLPFDQMKDKIRQSVHDQAMNLATIKFNEEVLSKHNFKLNEDVLTILYHALPKDKPVLPVPPKEEWPDLNIQPGDMNKVLMSWDGDSWDLRRFYDYYKATAWLGRPRRDKRLGGLRSFVTQIASKAIMPIEAKERGFYDRPEINDLVRSRKQQMIVTKLHHDLISPDVKPTDEQYQKYWDEHKEEYQKPPFHEGVVLVNHDEAKIRSARKEATKQGDWSDLVEKYGEESLMPKDKGAHFGPVAQVNINPRTPLLWQQKEIGEICDPMQLSDGTWGIGRLDKIQPAQEVALKDVFANVRQKVEAEVSEQIFQEKVGAWRKEYGVKTFPENLKQAVLKPKTASGAASGEEVS
ncbi:MAG TPA: peptidyl-prolyl cis-trans isomerase [Candidatus Krumholzibacteria bacterium]|nr:peptidyl-prolyl cis-trans isomerase [Candidatus Krumholzibacteria bacterium]